MKKIIALIVVAIFALVGNAYPYKVNLTKTGTSLVWSVENGTTYKAVLLENSAKVITEDSKEIELEVGESATPLYRALTGQGWTETDDSANVPQGNIGTAGNESYRFALLENGAELITENSLNVRLEN